MPTRRQRNDGAFDFDGDPRLLISAVNYRSRLDSTNDQSIGAAHFLTRIQFCFETHQPISFMHLHGCSTGIDSLKRMDMAKKKSLKTRAGHAAALILATSIGTACVSVNIAPKSGERSKGVDFRSPGSPFATLKDTRADGAWQNRENGNSISYFSTCHDPADPSLETVSRELFAELRDLKVLRQEQPSFNGREALDIEVEGKVEGVPTRIHALIFKKNDCTYTLSHIGLPRGFESDRKRFEDFLGSFQAP